MILLNWLRRFRAGSPLCRFDPKSWNRIANVLESIEGVGCRIEKTENGWGWKIIVGDGSDTEPPPGFPDDSGGGGGYPYGPEYPFGITFVADALIVWSGKLYHGWREIDWAGPADPDAPVAQVTGLTDGQTVYIRYAISTHAVDFVAAASYAEQAGYVLRALVTVGVAGGQAYMAKWWGGGLDTGLMGDRS